MARQTLYRFSRVEKTDIDGDRVQVAFASEFLGKQRADAEEAALGIAKEGDSYIEILSMDEKDADLSRLNNRAAFIDEHKPHKHLGRVVKAVRSQDGICRAVLEFDNASKLSKTRKAQMLSGSRPGISFGYSHTSYIGKRTLESGETAHVFAWYGREITSTAIPMDDTVGLNRSAANEKPRCIGCGGEFNRTDLDEDYYCEDCADAATPADDERVHPGGHMRTSDFPTPNTAMKFRAKKEDEKTEISYNDLTQKVSQAADSDKRFKTKRENGDQFSNFYVQDVKQTADGDGESEWTAVIVGPEYKSYEVDFEYDGKTVTLGEATEVEWKGEWKPVERSVSEPAKLVRSDPEKSNAVDLPKFVTELTPEQKENMRILLAPDSAAGLAPEVEARIRTEEATKTRTAMETEIKTRSGTEQEKVKARRTEIRALCDEFVKDHGENWAGTEGHVYVVGERLRSLQTDFVEKAADLSVNDSELRGDFKEKARALFKDERAPREQKQAANLDASLASRCSLGNLLRSAARSGEQTPSWQPKDGAEKEAHDELNRTRGQFPEIRGWNPTGIMLPANMPCGFDSNRLRSLPRQNHILKRDSLANDYASAGALIAPDFRFPAIEFLYNQSSIMRAGPTMLGGLLGDVVLPRQEAPTTAQSVAEGAALAEYDQIFGQIRMTPHRVGSDQKYSRLSLLQISPDFEAMIMRDHMEVVALWIDQMVLNGSGANNQPLGLLNQVGIGKVIFGGAASTAYIKARLMKTAIRKANIIDPITFLTTSAGAGMLATTAKILAGVSTNASFLPIWDDSDATDGTMLGSRGIESQQIPNDILVALAARHVVVAQWGGLAITLNTLTYAKNDEYELTVNTYIDDALRHAQAVVASDSVASLS
jgi:HK97 family phage major capsid protein